MLNPASLMRARGKVEGMESDQWLIQLDGQVYSDIVDAVLAFLLPSQPFTLLASL